MKTQTTFREIPIDGLFEIAFSASATYRKVAHGLESLYDADLGVWYNAAADDGGRREFLPGDFVVPILTPEQKKARRNAANRAKNQILRDLCGTSARAAREDMGM